MTREYLTLCELQELIDLNTDVVGDINLDNLLKQINHNVDLAVKDEMEIAVNDAKEEVKADIEFHMRSAF